MPLQDFSIPHLQVFIQGQLSFLQQFVYPFYKPFRVAKKRFGLLRSFSTVGTDQKLGSNRDGKQVAKLLIDQYNFPFFIFHQYPGMQVLHQSF